MGMAFRSHCSQGHTAIQKVEETGGGGGGRGWQRKVLTESRCKTEVTYLGRF